MKLIKTAYPICSLESEKERLFNSQKRSMRNPEKLMRNAIRNKGSANKTILLFKTKEVDQRAKRQIA